MSITITKAVPDDAESISAIEKISFGDPWSEKAIRESLLSPAVTSFKALDGDGRICGYAFLMVAADEAELINIAVDLRHRRLGIGSALLSTILETAEKSGVCAVYLEVRMSNISARALYERFGFKLIGTRRNYYKNPTEDAVLMKKSPEETQ